MLIGNFQTKLDLKKGRTALPKKFRQLLGKKVIVTSGYENSLMVVSYSSWEKVVGDVVNKPFIHGAARETDRFLLGNAFEVDLDRIVFSTLCLLSGCCKDAGIILSALSLNLVFSYEHI